MREKKDDGKGFDAAGASTPGVDRCGISTR
jgi:hypothetical protein